MKRKTSLRIAAFFTLFTFVGHTINLILPLPEDQREVITVYNLMKQTMVAVPLGSPKSIAQFMVGANSCVSVLLLLAGVFYIFLATDPVNPSSRRQLVVLNLSMLAVSIISFIFFFPVPAVCTGLAAIFGFMGLQSTEKP